MMNEDVSDIIEKSCNSNMEQTDLMTTMRHLYESADILPGIPLAPTVEFHDPIVAVYGSGRVVRMFRRLNRLFPASVIDDFAPVPGEDGRFALCVHYRRRPESTPKVFRSIVDVELTDGQLIRLVEHWTHPVPLRGDGRGVFSRWVRKGLGRILS